MHQTTKQITERLSAKETIIAYLLVPHRGLGQAVPLNTYIHTPDHQANHREILCKGDHGSVPTGTQPPHRRLGQAGAPPPPPPITNQGGGAPGKPKGKSDKPGESRRSGKSVQQPVSRL